MVWNAGNNRMEYKLFIPAPLLEQLCICTAVHPEEQHNESTVLLMCYPSTSAKQECIAHLHHGQQEIIDLFWMFIFNLEEAFRVKQISAMGHSLQQSVLNLIFLAVQKIWQFENCPWSPDQMDATCWHNIVVCLMLHPFDHHVACKLHQNQISVQHHSTTRNNVVPNCCIHLVMAYSQ